MKRVLIFSLLLLVTPGVATLADTPYRGLETREIKALSQGKIDDLRAGRGMGMALAAELNNYPGPRHVLDLSEQIGLSAEQHKQVSALFDEMAAQAKELGESIVAAEKRLDSLFADERAEKANLRSYTADIAKLNGELRYLHMRYHIDVRRLLSDTQITRYGELRGYGSRGEGRGGEMDAGHGHGHGHGHGRGPYK